MSPPYPDNTMTVDITIFYITGRQLGPIHIPQSWCEECDLTKRLVSKTVSEMGIDARVRVQAKPWLANIGPALLKGGWHPPVLLINGKIHSQGIVPDAEELRKALTEQLRDQDVAVT